METSLDLGPHISRISILEMTLQYLAEFFHSSLEKKMKKMTHRYALLTWCQSHEPAVFCRELTIVLHLPTWILPLDVHICSLFFSLFIFLYAIPFKD